MAKATSRRTASSEGRLRAAAKRVQAVAGQFAGRRVTAGLVDLDGVDVLAAVHQRPARRLR
jgi:hypothetical protein